MLLILFDGEASAMQLGSRISSVTKEVDEIKTDRKLMEVQFNCINNVPHVLPIKFELQALVAKVSKPISTKPMRK